jgi:uncharacterized protein (TIGR03118 family)
MKSVSFWTLLFFVSLSVSAVAESQGNAYIQKNLVASHPEWGADAVDPKLINAWGIAIRPAGAGGHFWVTGADQSFEYVGDVQASPDPKLRTLHLDDLTHVTLPVGGKESFATGVVFNGSKDSFVITQSVKGADPITAPAKFLFASDGGIISAWTERKKPDGTFDWPSEAKTVIDLSEEGAQFFGLAINKAENRLYAADFGKNPKIYTFDAAFKPVNVIFDNPFDDNKNGKVDPGEYAPFNIQGLTTPAGDYRLFVAYAKTQVCPDEEIAEGTCRKGELFVGEEDTSKPGLGRLAEFTEDGKLVAVWNDGEKLSAPWGVVFAPKEGFGALSGHLLVANFGDANDGTIAAFDPKTRTFKDYLRDPNGKPVVIDKVWGLLFGNGESLGDKNALYFAAGPKDETHGLFGSLRVVR